MADDVSGFSAKERGGKGEIEFVGKDEDDSGGFLPRAGELTRANTDMTLVGTNEEIGGLAVKAS